MLNENTERKTVTDIKCDHVCFRNINDYLGLPHWPIMDVAFISDLNMLD